MRAHSRPQPPFQVHHRLLLLLVLLGISLAVAARAATLIETNAVWRMQKGTNEVSTPISAWRANGFTDTVWPELAAPFHFGEASVVGGTRLSDMQNRYSSIFLRHPFVVADPAELASLTLRAACDDGFVAWINGTEVVRYRVNDGDLRYSSLANSSAPEPIEFLEHVIDNPARFLVPGGNVLAVQAFNRARDNGDFQFNASLVSHVRDDRPPTLVGIVPPPGVLTALTEITVAFSKPVTGVDEEDLVVNGVPAEAVTGAGTTYRFSFPQPALGQVTISWRSDHGITDLATPPNPFTPAGNQASWSYTLSDLTPPRVLTVTPPGAAQLRRLTQVEVGFSEPVVGLDAADLRVNGQPAASVSGLAAGPYVFQFPEPAAGLIQLSWATSHGITDRGSPPNLLAGQTWSYTLDPDGPEPEIVLNEIVPANVNGLTDEDGDAEDWIELWNRGTSPVNVAGWGLTDDADAPGKWLFPSVTLGVGQYLVVFASGKDRRETAANARLHTNFKLADDGEYLGLSAAESPRVAVSEFAPRYPDSRNDYSYGWTAAGEGRYFSPPTPGAPNGSSSTTGVVSRVEFLLPHGWYEAPVDLVLSNATPGAVIRYTLNGSEPSATTGTVYSGPLRLTQSSVVRAAAFAATRLPSRVETRTYLMPASVSAQPAAPAGFPANWGSSRVVPADYEMDARVIHDVAYADRLEPALASLPSLSLVMPVDDWFSAARGIYSNGDKTGLAWERRCSAELLRPDGREGFRVACGLRIQGGTSPSPWRDYKLSLRLIFRSDYGPGRLEYGLFPDSAVDTFETLVLDAGYNYTWSYNGGVEPPVQRERAQYVRDQFASDLQTASGTPAFYGRYVHLFLNGLYWGLYDVHEDPKAALAAARYGGSEEEYDVVKHTGSNVIEGTAEAWNAMMALARAGLDDPGRYEAIQQMLDVPGLVDYLLVHFYIGNTDWPHHNWYAFRRRVPGGVWRFLSWDSEHCLKEVNHDRTNVGDADTPAEIYSRLRANPEFRLLFADRVHRHFFNGGSYYVDPANPAWDPTHPERNRPAARYEQRLREIDPAIVLESARWGDSQRPEQPFTRDREWLAEVNRLMSSYFPLRSGVVLNQLRSLGLYPQVAAPAFNQHGGYVPRAFPLAMTAPGGTIYYTLDGSDPRVPLSGAVAPGARVYTNGVPVLLDRTVELKARVRSGAVWSALNEARFQVAELGVPLRATELMYHPPGGESYEFIELQNIGTVPLDLGGFTLEGAQFTFPLSSLVRPGEVIVLASAQDPAAFALRYPAVRVWMTYPGSLSNQGERLTLRDGEGRVIWTLDYRDDRGWPAEADGQGHSLEVMDLDSSPSDPANWRASALPGGSPGSVAPPPAPPAVRLNEVMAANRPSPHGAPAAADWIELFNAGGTEIDLGGWHLGDALDPQRFEFPHGTRIGPGAHLLVWCDHATNAAGLHTGFALDYEGESLFLYDPATNRVDALTFGAQVPDHTIGRVTDGTWQLTQPTPAAPNLAAATASPATLALNEWLANPLPGDDDWVELYCRATDHPVALKNLHLATADAVFAIRSLAFIAPGAYLRLWCVEEPGARHVEFKLPATGGLLGLRDAAGGLIDQVTYPAQTEDRSSGRLPDGSVMIQELGAVTPGAPNSTDPARSDRDGDGLPDAWEVAHGLDPRGGGGDDGPFGDPDRDGAGNFSEFRAGTDPEDASSRLGLEVHLLAEPGIQLLFVAIRGRSYRVEYAERLEDEWHLLKAIGPVDATGDFRLSELLPLPDAARFYRIVLVDP